MLDWARELKVLSFSQEKDVSEEYLASLHEKHQVWLEEGKTKSVNVL